MQDDLLVVGLNLETGREVHVSDAGREYWYARGYSGRRTLVCALCYAGIDAEPGTRVPLLIRSKTGGQRRPHFAHPPGQAPAGGHHPESLWHLTAKAVLAACARRQTHRSSDSPCTGSISLTSMPGWGAGRPRAMDGRSLWMSGPIMIGSGRIWTRRTST